MDNIPQEHDETIEKEQKTLQEIDKEVEELSSSDSNEEQRYLENIRERLLVLFEGFQSPNNTQIEAKVDLTLNFLEYLLSTIDTRLDKIK
jgi:hypothetical protein